jgi:hypothetical protein
MNEELEKNPVGRPFKMTNWIPSLQAVLDNNSVVFLTDKDLVFLVNKSLPIEDRITTRCFKNWKAGKFAPNEELGLIFLEMIEEALIKEKLALGEALKNDKTGQWVRYAWILERKFEEFNLKYISESTHKNEHSQVIQITAGNNEQKKMIENLIDADFEEIIPNSKNDVDSTTDNKADDYEF